MAVFKKKEKIEEMIQDIKKVNIDVYGAFIRGVYIEEDKVCIDRISQVIN